MGGILFVFGVQDLSILDQFAVTPNTRNYKNRPYKWASKHVSKQFRGTVVAPICGRVCKVSLFCKQSQSRNLRQQTVIMWTGLSWREVLLDAGDSVIILSMARPSYLV